MPDAVTLGERLRALSGGVAVAVRLDPHEYADQYFNALASSLRDVSVDADSYTIYVSITNPASLVSSLAQALDVPMERLAFVDAISHIMMNYRDPLPNATYIESPRMLEDIMLRVEFLLRKHPSQHPIVVIDSVTSLAIHNPPDLLTEFLHILLTNLKSRQVLTILFAVSDDQGSTMDQMLNLVVDESMDVGAGRGLS